jgi:hypothetical protein
LFPCICGYCSVTTWYRLVYAAWGWTKRTGYTDCIQILSPRSRIILIFQTKLRTLSLLFSQRAMLTALSSVPSDNWRPHSGMPKTVNTFIPGVPGTILVWRLDTKLLLEQCVEFYSFYPFQETPGKWRIKCLSQIIKITLIRKSLESLWIF